jgi:hypothetical protein
MNRYQGTLKIGNGYQKVFIEANSLYNAKQMFESMYGAGKVINVCQVS